MILLLYLLLSVRNQQVGGGITWPLQMEFDSYSCDQWVRRHLKDQLNFVCENIPAACVQCDITSSSASASASEAASGGCNMGEQIEFDCRVPDAMNLSKCSGRTFRRLSRCLLCHQTRAGIDYTCKSPNGSSCSLTSTAAHLSPLPSRLVECRVRPRVACLGPRRFSRHESCAPREPHANARSTCSWRTAVLLSATLGGFGADRFYLGLWESAIAKLLSFGGLGLWTLVDLILVACGYLPAADGFPCS